MIVGNTPLGRSHLFAGSSVPIVRGQFNCKTLKLRSMDIMAQRKTAKKSTRKSAKSSTATADASAGFTAEERAAMRERVKELKAAGAGKDADERAVLEKIAAMPAPDRAMGERLHAVIKA